MIKRTFFIFSSWIFLSYPVNAKPLILSSIKPLSLIAQEIGRDDVEIDTLLPATASPHEYPLKVSDYGRIQKADIVLWIGPELESFLQKPISNLPAKKVIEAYDLKGMNWPTEAHREIADAHHHDRDPHVWLDPRNAAVIAGGVADKLIEIDPAHIQQYQKNLREFQAKMIVLDEKLKVILKSSQGLGFAVYHEGYAHFVSHYELKQLDYVTLTPERRPGAKHLDQLRQVLSDQGKCLFLEPFNDQQSMRDLALQLKLQVGTLDALGVEQTNSYTQLLERMAEAFSTCLANRAH